MFLPYKLVIAGENGNDSYFIKRAGYTRRALNRLVVSRTFFVLALVGLPIYMLYRAANRRGWLISIMLMTGLLATTVIYS